MSAHEQIHASGSSEWYTPAWLIERARLVMGAIDLDPASCDEANAVVGANTIYTKADNGLEFAWRGRVFLNPPSRIKGGDPTERIALWVHKLLHEYVEGNVTQATLLVPAVPDRKWFRQLWGRPMCFLYQRIKFSAPAGFKTEQPTHPHVVVYFKDQLSGALPEHRFRRAFEDLGHIVDPVLTKPGL